MKKKSFTAFRPNPESSGRKTGSLTIKGKKLVDFKFTSMQPSLIMKFWKGSIFRHFCADRNFFPPAMQKYKAILKKIALSPQRIKLPSGHIKMSRLSARFFSANAWMWEKCRRQTGQWAFKMQKNRHFFAAKKGGEKHLTQLRTICFGGSLTWEFVHIARQTDRSALVEDDCISVVSELGIDAYFIFFDHAVVHAFILAFIFTIVVVVFVVSVIVFIKVRCRGRFGCKKKRKKKLVLPAKILSK